MSGKIITNNKSFIAWRQELELLMAMHERANGLLPGEADVATVKRLVTSWYNALRNTTYECPGEKLMMTQLLHEVKLSLDNGDSVDLGILLDRITEIFHVDEGEVENHE